MRVWVTPWYTYRPVSTCPLQCPRIQQMTTALSRRPRVRHAKGSPPPPHRTLPGGVPRVPKKTGGGVASLPPCFSATTPSGYSWAEFHNISRRQTRDFFKAAEEGRGVPILPPPHAGGGGSFGSGRRREGGCRPTPLRIQDQASFPAADPEIILPGFFDGAGVFAQVSIPTAQGKSGH